MLTWGLVSSQNEWAATLSETGVIFEQRAIFFAIFSVSRVSWCHKSCQQDFLEGSRMAYVRIFSSCEDLDWILGIFDEQLILDCVIVWYHPFVYQSTNLTEKNLINNSGCHVIHHNRAIKRVTRVVVVRESITMNWLAMWFYQSVGFPPLHHNFPKYFLV